VLGFGVGQGTVEVAEEGEVIGHEYGEKEEKGGKEKSQSKANVLK
jgi:hypothetical protein